MRTPELVLLGGPNSGKTHYAGQLYGRLQRRPGVLRMRQQEGAPPNLAALEEVLGCLEDGMAAAHTPTDQWAEITLPLIDVNGQTIDLRWPDYGGEQLKSVFRDRAVAEAWKDRLAQADGWVLMLRLQGETTYPDALSKLTQNADARQPDQERAATWDANAYWVELLQILMQVAGIGTAQRVAQPRLIVLLSCYDELNAGDRPPSEVLAERLPLVSSFIHSNWDLDSLSVWGLSALGKPLESNRGDDAFLDDGPEQHGWVIPPSGGEVDPDLSLPLAWLLEPR